MKNTSSAIRASAMAMLLWWGLAAQLELGLGCLSESSGHSGGSGQGVVREHGVAARELAVRGRADMGDCGGDARARRCEELDVGYRGCSG